MRQNHVVHRSLLVITLGALLAACDKSPTSPPPPKPAGDVNRLEITGPFEVAPGGTLQLHLTAHFNDGTSRDVTNEALWTSSAGSLLSVTRGLVTAAGTTGQAIVRAVFAGISVENEMIVVPAGTFRVVGKITETAGNGYGVPGARVEAVSASGTLVTATSFNGDYVFFGLAGATEMHVTKDGYQPRVQRVNVAAHERIDLELGLQTARPDLSGTYTLTLRAADACREHLPQETLIRTYSAVVTQQGPRLTVSLQGANFVSGITRRQDRFYGSIETTRPEFELQDFFEDSSCSFGPSHECYVLGDVLEEINPTTYFNPTGKVAATVSSSGMSGRLSGTVYVRTVQNGKFPPTASCASDSHRFELSR